MRRRTLLTSVLAGAAGAVALPAGPVLAAPATRFGVIASTQGPPADDADTFRRLYEQQRALFGGGPIGIRLFAGDRLPLAGDSGMVGALLGWAAAEHPDEPITISHKTRDDGRLRALLDWAQAHHVRLSVIYFHEVQDDWVRRHDARADPAVYRETYRAYRRIIRAHPARGQVTLEKNLMWYWQHYNAKHQGGDWRLFVEHDDPADVVSWDTYVFPGMPVTFPHSDQGRYATPDEFFGYARDVWRETGRPWGVGEIGSTVQDGVGVGAKAHWDRGGAKFAAWVGAITAAAAARASIGPEYAGMPAARFMKWWAAPDADGSEQGLQQVPAALAAYRRLVQAAPLV